MTVAFNPDYLAAGVEAIDSDDVDHAVDARPVEAGGRARGR